MPIGQMWEWRVSLERGVQRPAAWATGEGQQALLAIVRQAAARMRAHGPAAPRQRGCARRKRASHHSQGRSLHSQGKAVTVRLPPPLEM